MSKSVVYYTLPFDNEDVYKATRVTVRGTDVGSAADYRAAMSNEGPKRGDWADKPHRLIYDLCLSLVDRDLEIAHLREMLAADGGGEKTPLNAIHVECPAHSAALFDITPAAATCVPLNPETSRSP